MKRLLCLIGIHDKPRNRAGFRHVYCFKCGAGEMIPISSHYHDCLSAIVDKNDPRFKELRIERCPHALPVVHSEDYYCIGYEVKHDLSILLSIVVNEFDNVLLMKAVLLSLHLEMGKLNITPEAILHSASRVVHQWLEEQEKVS